MLLSSNTTTNFRRFKHLTYHTYDLIGPYNTNVRDELHRYVARIQHIPFVRKLYFRLPLFMRLRIRRLTFFNSKINYKDISLREIDFDHIPNRRVTLDDLNRLDSGTEALWKCSTLARAKANYAIHKDLSGKVFNLTVDIWDTAIGRHRPAEGVKYSTALFISLQDWQSKSFTGLQMPVKTIYESRNEIESSQVYIAGEASLEVTLKEIKKRLNLLFDLDKAFDFEKDQEKKFTYGVDVVSSLIDKFDQNVLFISDFHMKGEHLHEILVKNGFEVLKEQIVSSADLMKSKRKNGELYQFLNLTNQEGWIHVGDNPIADWEFAEKEGADVIRVTKKSANSWHGHELKEEELVRDLDNFLGSTSADRFLINVATIAYSICTTAISKAWSSNVTKVVYLSREGLVLKNAHDEISQLDGLKDFPKIQGIHFPTSRSAIVMASWADDVAAGLEDVSLQYPISTVDSLIETLSIPQALHEIVYRNFGRLERFSTSTAWERLDKAAQNEIQDYLREQRSLIKDFLLSEQITPKDVVLCDLGWRGSIQDAMARIVGANFQGQYLGVFRPFNNKSSGAKEGLLFDEVLGNLPPKFLSFLGPIERAFTVTNRPVIAYGKSEDRVQPIYSKNIENQVDARIIAMEEYFQDAVRMVGESMLSVGFFGKGCRTIALTVIEDWILRPNANHASTWFDEKHSEGFGAGDKTHYDISTPSNSWLGMSLISRISNGAKSSLWPNGYLAWLKVENVMKGQISHE